MNPIPYTVERRPDTGLNNVQLGVWLFLASEAMLFAGLFSAYFTLRAGAVEAWQPLRDHLGAAGRNTVVLIAGTAAFTSAIGAARARRVLPGYGRVMMFRYWLFASMLFAIAFCFLKAGEHAELFARHRGPETSTQMAVYYLLTGVHMMHVFGGCVVNAWLMLTTPRTWRDAAPLVINRLEAVALYWYFVDLVWLILVVLLYVA